MTEIPDVLQEAYADTEAVEQGIREQNAELVNAYHAQGMPMGEAIHRFIEEYYEEESDEC